MNNEDYLDSLLKAAEEADAQAAENPNSAINRVRGMANGANPASAPVVEDKTDVEEIPPVEETSVEEPSVDDLLKSLEDIPAVDEASVSEEEPSVEDLLRSLEEIPTAEETPVVEEAPVVEEEPSVDDLLK